MSIQHQLRSFWWFLDGRVGGMGRPGFNRCHWFDLPLEEALLLSWLGKQPLTTPALADLWSHLDTYGPKVAPFYGLTPQALRDRLARLHERDALLYVTERLNTKASIFDEIAWVDDPVQPTLRLIPNVQQRQHEVALLQQQRVVVLVSLLEQPLDHAELSEAFELHHLPVEDVTPPRREQVYAFAQTLHEALAADKTVVAHCLAGIGRTTTMLIAAYLVNGYSLQELTDWIQVRNPHFVFRGSQVTFLQELAADLRDGRAPFMTPTRSLPLCP